MADRPAGLIFAPSSRILAAMPKPKTDAPKFEAALGSLEEIVGAMENGELPLDQLIERYEEGMRLVKFCQEKLAEAEQKIEIVTKAAEAGAGTAPKADGPALF